MIAHRWAGATLAIGCAIGCGARTELTARAAADAGLDTGLDAAHDALDAAHDALDADAADAGGPDASPVCDFGTIVSDPFGSVVEWNGGAPIPAGHYRITYVDGCMKYSSSQGWTVNAYPNGPDTLWVVGSGVDLASAPGTVGFLVGQGAFASFDACVSANVSQDVPLEIDFTGGTLGLLLADDPYSDNVAGEGGRNPTYRLSSCP